MNTDEIISVLEELDTNEDIVIGLPEVNELSDGDSDKSDEEAEGTTEHLSRLVLSAPAHFQEDDNEEEEETAKAQPK